jgi:hypothetical protein
MPRYDGTGPHGDGPKTGRGRGYCGENSENKKNFRNGFGKCFRGRCFERSYEDEKEFLESKKSAIEKRLKDLK